MSYLPRSAPAWAAVVGAIALVGFAEPGAAAAERHFTLETKMAGFFGVGGEIDHQRNPTLVVDRDDVVTVDIVNGDPMAHDFVADANRARSAQLFAVGAKTSVTFTAKVSEAYYCSVPGHRQYGMEGKLEVKGAPAAAPAASAEHGSESAAMPMQPAAAPPLPAKLDQARSIDRNVAEVPPPIQRSEPAVVRYHIRTEEVIGKLENGTTFEYWTYDGKVPGPMLRARVGDTVEVTLENVATSKMVHSIDFHCATGPGGGAAFLQVPPGQQKTVHFKALDPGLYVYHCATPHIPTHLARGMYGMILVEPEAGLPRVDREFYVMQGELYTQQKPRTKCHQVQDDDRLFDERATYVIMNGSVGSITGGGAMTAKVGERVRVYFGVGGPNLTSSLHIIGEVFDTVYREGDVVGSPARHLATTMVPAGGAAIVEMSLETSGSFALVDHSLGRLDKGAIALLTVSGPADPSVLGVGPVADLPKAAADSAVLATEP